MASIAPCKGLCQQGRVHHALRHRCKLAWHLCRPLQFPNPNVSRNLPVCALWLPLLRLDQSHHRSIKEGLMFVIFNPHGISHSLVNEM